MISIAFEPTPFTAPRPKRNAFVGDREALTGLVDVGRQDGMRCARHSAMFL